MDTDERREFPRLPINMTVDYNTYLSEDAQTTKTESKNISAGGIRIIALGELEVGKKMQLKFSIPDANITISAVGKVVWTEEFIVGSAKTGKAYEVGIEFISITDEDRKKIEEYVKKRLLGPVT